MSAALSGKQRIAAIAKAAQAELARRDFLAFCAHLNSGFQTPPHIAKIAQLLEQVERGELQRLIICLPPGSGKSTLLQNFCAWYLGRGSKRRIITASSSAELSERNSRASRALIDCDDWPFEAKLSGATFAQARWDVLAGGGLYATGVSGSITGWRANLFVGDDLTHDEATQVERDSTARWLSEMAIPRLEPGGAIVLIGTRWAEDDLLGRQMSGPNASQWVVCSLPAIAGEDDPLGRQPGEALWSQRWPLAELERRRIEMGGRSFSAQYLCDPLPQTGSTFRSEWFVNRYKQVPAFEKTVCALDAASKTGISNDFSVIVTIGCTKNGFYLLDVARQRVEFPGLLKMAAAVFEKWHPSAFYLESSSNAVALSQQLRSETHLPVVPIVPKGSKQSRADAITGVLEAGKLVLPQEAGWLVEFERELLSFPYGKHDDQVDALTLALGQVQHTPFVFAEGLHALYVLAVTTGMRQGELLGLRWENVDLDARALSVRHQLAQDDQANLILTEPKTAAGRRRIELPQVAIAALREQQRRLLAEGLRASPWVFPDTRGGPMRKDNLVHRSFSPLLKRAGLPQIRFHDLRHTAATLMLLQGVHAKVVQERLGHSKIALTLDTYSHVLPSMQRDAADQLDHMFLASDSAG